MEAAAERHQSERQQMAASFHLITLMKEAFLTFQLRLSTDEAVQGGFTLLIDK